MTSREFRERLSSRAQWAQAPLPAASVDPLEEYFRLLALWNEKINLTGLPLQAPSDETFDRLFIEPLAASSHIGSIGGAWFDLGSGGGSPAIPLKIVLPSLHLTMVESKSRKAAFLREAIRTLGLADTTVVNERFEGFATSKAFTPADLVTVRAVRADTPLFRAAERLLRDGGHLVLFQSGSTEFVHEAFEHVKTAQLTPLTTFLGIYKQSVPRGTKGTKPLTGTRPSRILVNGSQY